MRKININADLKSINKVKCILSYRYISDREKGRSMKRTDSAFHENGYNQNNQEKHGLFDMIQVYSSMQSTWNNLQIHESMMDGMADNPSRQGDSQSRFGKLPFAMT